MYLQRTEERYGVRKMKQEFSDFIWIFNWKKDKFILMYPKEFENWKIYHIGYKEVCTYICKNPEFVV